MFARLGEHKHKGIIYIKMSDWMVFEAGSFFKASNDNEP